MKTLKYLPVLLVLGVILSCGEEVTTPNTTPPDAVTNLGVQNSSEGLLLRWTAPGDDRSKGQVSRYDIRYTIGTLAFDWESATTIPFSYRPKSPGSAELFVFVPSVKSGTWRFGLKAADEVPNWSELSNIATITIIAPDTIPPASVTDLRVESITRGTVVLEWTASGDDSLSGKASAYDLRYAMGTITPETWADATPVTGLSAPGSTGETESFTVTGLEIGQEYEFALKVADESQNWSGMSNVATAFISTFAPFQLTFNGSYYGATFPDWSPDGNALACVMGFASDFSRRRQIFVVPASGGNAVQYSFFAEGAMYPSWSPDGSQFAFLKPEARGDRTVWVLAVMNSSPGASAAILADHDPRAVVMPRWSPDGSRIVYKSSITPGSRIISDIYTIPSNGGTPTLLVGGFSSQGLNWSPDGTQVVYDSDQLGSSDIWIISANGGEATRLTSDAGAEQSPVWDPDGSRIAYVADGKIWAIPATSGTPTRLVDDSGIIPYRGLAWSPDGSRMAYTKVQNNIPNIWVATIQ